MTPQEIAERACKIMWDSDTASEWAGMSLGPVAPGAATVTMTVRPEHCNGHGTAHGGVIYMLAGTAFAMAINSYNVRAVAQAGSITYLAPGNQGDQLKATSTEVVRAGRNGIYNVAITNQSNETIAEFRGNSRVIGGTLFEK